MEGIPPELFGAVADGTTDDQAAIMRAIDVAAAEGCPVELAARTYAHATPILFPSHVQIIGTNAGSQVGGKTKLKFTGSGAAAIGPRNRSANTVNVTICGVHIDGGGGATIGLDMYRTSYSRIEDCSVSNVLASTGIGVQFDAQNTTGQCYFNVADNVKVDGCPVGVKFRQMANANQWRGGKIGNGGTGAWFEGESVANVFLSVDFEDASTQHVYVDATANVFLGCHMENAPIGFNITADGWDTRRFGNTIATTVTQQVVDASERSVSLDRIDDDASAMTLDFTRLVSTTGSPATTLSVDPMPLTVSSMSLIELFRYVTSNIGAQVLIYKGDGTATEQIKLDGRGAVIKIANRSSTPTTPTGGGILYVEGGALKYVGSSGTVTTLGSA